VTSARFVKQLAFQSGYMPGLDALLQPGACVNPVSASGWLYVPLNQYAISIDPNEERLVQVQIANAGDATLPMDIVIAGITYTGQVEPQ
jgi:hypothetical protein